MNDLDLRTAFAHLKEDVMATVSTEERLAQITGRRSWVRPATRALTGAAAVALIVGAAVLALRPDTDQEPLPPATDTTLPGTTTPETVPPDDGIDIAMIGVIGTPLVAGSDGVTMVTADGSAVIAEGRPITLVVSDGNGGLVVQIDDRIEWLRNGDQDRVLVDATSASPDGEPVSIRLEDVAVIDDAVNVLFTVSGGIEEQRYEEVWRYDLTTDAIVSVYRTGAYEGGLTRVSHSAGRFVLTRQAEGFSWFVFLDDEGRELDVAANPKPDTAFDLPVVDQAVLSPDGTTLIYLASGQQGGVYDGTQAVELVVYDFANGVEVRRIRLPQGEWRYTRVDFDGVGVVLSRDEIGERQDGELDFLPIEVLWIRSLEADAAITSPGVVGAASVVKYDRPRS